MLDGDEGEELAESCCTFRIGDAIENCFRGVCVWHETGDRMSCYLLVCAISPGFSRVKCNPDVTHWFGRRSDLRETVVGNEISEGFV